MGELRSAPMAWSHREATPVPHPRAIGEQPRRAAMRMKPRSSPRPKPPRNARTGARADRRRALLGAPAGRPGSSMLQSRVGPIARRVGKAIFRGAVWPTAGSRAARGRVRSGPLKLPRDHDPRIPWPRRTGFKCEPRQSAATMRGRPRTKLRNPYRARSPRPARRCRCAWRRPGDCDGRLRQWILISACKAAVDHDRGPMRKLDDQQPSFS